MSVTQDDVVKIAHLARLAIDETEMQGYADKLTQVMDMVEQMNAVDVEGVEMMSHPLNMSQRLREDEVTESNHRDEYQAVSPSVENGLFLVPKVIE